MDEYSWAGEYILQNAKVPKDGWKEQIKQAKQECDRFRNMYNPDRLELLSESEVYDKLFRYESGSMIFALRRKDTILGECGHTSVYKNRYPFYESGSDIVCGSAMPLYAGKTITREQAGASAVYLCQNLISCVRYLEKNSLQKEEDYLQFEKYAEEKLDNLYRYVWVHKYLHILFPNSFTQIHSFDHRKKILNAMGMSGIKSVFEADYHLQKIQMTAGISDPFAFAHMIYSVPEIMTCIKSGTKIPVTTKKPITFGTYGNWIIKSPKRAFLKCGDQLTVGSSFAIPTAIGPFFEIEEKSKGKICLELEGKEVQVKLIQKGDNFDLVIPEETRTALQNRAWEHQCDIVLSLSPNEKNGYMANIIETPAELEIPGEEKEQEKQAIQLPEKLLYSIAKKRSQETSKKAMISTVQYKRDPYIAEYAKRRAKGICQLCGQPAPFLDKKGQPYLESHHIIYLSKGGADSVENTVALCPNCHKKVHLLERQEDIDILQEANKKPMK